MSLSGCAAWPRGGKQPCCLGAKPFIRRQPIGWHLFDVTVVSPLAGILYPIRIGRKALGVPIGALNLQQGRIVASAFFTDRDPAALSPEEVRWGPTRPVDAALPPFVITKLKTEGKTPGFFVADARGARYLFKLDPVQAPGLLSGAEVVASKLLHALGYHVPSDEVVFVRPGDLRPAPDLVRKGSRGGRKRFEESDLEEWLQGRLQEGYVRVVASKILEGEILGPASFKRFRDCAEMRALKLAYAWLNNIDAKDHNSLLVWDGKRTVGYLIDFGTSLGADAGKAGSKDACAGRTHVVDLSEIPLEVLTLGRYRKPCDLNSRVFSAAVGRFSPDLDPDRWKAYAPNLAFQAMSKDDALWMARRLARLSRSQIEAAVSAGQYRDPKDAAYLIDALEARRLAIVRRYLREN